MMKNSIEMLICLEIVKKWNIQKSKASWWVAFMAIRNTSNNSSFIYKPTQEIHDKQVPKHDFNK